MADPFGKPSYAELLAALEGLHAWADRLTPDGLSNKEWAELDSAIQEAGAVLQKIKENQ